MDGSTAATVCSVGLVLVVLVLTGPLVGAVGVDGEGSDLGDGTATVGSIRTVDEFAMTPGRFGTGVLYLRIPDVRAEFESVTGRSRLVYRVAVPALGFDRVGTRQVGPDTGSVTVGMSDRAFAPRTTEWPPSTVTVTVRIQSFTVDRTVLQRNVTVGLTDG
jgi:hypothetical protein